MSGASSDPSSYLWELTAATTRGNSHTQKHLILLFLNTAILIIFLVVKTDEVQLILVSAVILMPGACVFPTTTWRSSAAAAAAAGGRCSTQPRRKFKGDPSLRLTLGHTGISLLLYRVAALEAVTGMGKLAVRFRGGEVKNVGGVVSVFARPVSRVAVPEQGT